MYKTAGFNSVGAPLRWMNDQTILNKQPRVSQASIRDHRTQASCSLINIEINPHLSKRNFSERTFSKYA